MGRPDKKKHAPKRTAAQREVDLHQLSMLFARGFTQYQCADWFTANRPYKLTRSQIAYDLEELRQVWLRECADNIALRKAEELHKINRLEATALEAWERSCQPRETTVQENKETEFATRKDKPVKFRKASITKENRDGNPAFLAIVQNCIRQRCAILGVLAPVETILSGPDGQPIHLTASVAAAPEVAAAEAKHADAVLAEYYARRN